MFISPGSRAKAGGKPFPTGTQMMFINAVAPLGWVRVATFDDALLRIVGSNTPSSGGTNGFVATVNGQTGTGTGVTGTGNTGTGTAGNSSLSTAQLASHTHGSIPVLGSPGLGGCTQTLTNTLGGSTAGAGSGSTHNHTVPALTIPALTVPSLTVTFGIKYVDALIARKS